MLAAEQASVLSRRAWHVAGPARPSVRERARTDDLQIAPREGPQQLRRPGPSEEPVGTVVRIGARGRRILAVESDGTGLVANYDAVSLGCERDHPVHRRELQRVDV